MKLFVKHFIDELTGKIVHVATSDAPIPDDVVVEDESFSLQPNPVYRIEQEELEATEFIRGGDMRQMREVSKDSGHVEGRSNLPERLRGKIIKKVK